MQSRMHYAFTEEKNRSYEAGRVPQGAYICAGSLRIRHKIYCAAYIVDACSRLLGVGGVSARANARYMYLQSGLKKKCHSRRPSWPLP